LNYWKCYSISCDPITWHPISAEELKVCARAQSVESQYGDRLLIRMGWIDK
jgi:hypothetical protein